MLQVYESLFAWIQNDMYPILWVVQFILGQSVIHLLLYTPLYPFDCLILQVIVSLRASLEQLIISVVVTIHQTTHILNWSQIVTSIDLLKCCYNLASVFRAQAVKKFAHRFLSISCSGRQGDELFLLFCKFKACIKTYVDFKL